MNRAVILCVLFAGTLLSSTPANAFWHGRWNWIHAGWGYPVWLPYNGGYACAPGCCGPACCGACWGGPTCGWGVYGAGYANYAYRPFVYPTIPGGYSAVPFSAAPLPAEPLTSLDPAPAVTAARAPAPPPVSDLSRVLNRVASVESRRKAERMLGEGDELFRAQNFHSALQRYKLAASTAPDFAEAFWRKGHALIATHNYELAIAAFRRALDLSEDVHREGFQLNDIYAGAQVTKKLQLEALAEWALARTDSPDAWFLVGVTLYFDGQQPRAQKFFSRAQSLSSTENTYVRAFTRRAPVAAALPPVRPAIRDRATTTLGTDT